MVKRYELGEQVKLVSTGQSYASPSSKHSNMSEVVWKYVMRYKPINVRIYNDKSYKSLEIVSSYRTKSDLALKDNLTWKIKYICNCFNGYSRKILYFLQSNENHLLVITSGGFKMLNEEEK